MTTFWITVFFGCIVTISGAQEVLVDRAVYTFQNKGDFGVYNYFVFLIGPYE